ncbi:hypothetical protein MNB_SV-5-151 [hydrothermal vent metagenome]|uniref:Uncharacterized protein n=1 Tax=hydrothermal vent metagenome TaxID=652676 RepID=A0A1W1ECN1_9ZZZZ
MDDMKVYPIRSIEDASLLFAINMDLHNATNIDECTKISLSQFEEWSMHPGNLFLACEYKSRLVGLFFSVRVKHEVFEKLMNFEMKKSEITDADFADVDEVGSNVLLSFYAVNVKVATMLFIRHYAYLIANQKIIEEVGVITSVSEVKKTLSNMNLKLYKNRLLENSVNVETYREKLKYVLASEYVVKMIFSK